MTEKIKVDLPTFYGTKIGMTRIFDDAGNHVPVTVIKLESNIISQVKTKDKDGYEAYQLAYGEKRAKLISKPAKGHLAKAKIEQSFSHFAEVRIENVTESVIGQEVSYNLFTETTAVDVTAISKGKGFQGVMKRYHFAGGPAAHGSHFHRKPGAIGNRATPARVFPEKKMPGHMGVVRITMQNLKVVQVNLDKGYMLIRGNVPGPKNGFVRISKARK